MKRSDQPQPYDYERERQPQAEPGPQKGRKPPSKGRPVLLRCISLVALFAVASVALGLRLSTLQIDEAAEWEARASRQQLANIPIVPLRGNIYDANGKLLAQSATVWTVEASPEALNQSRVSKDSAEREAARIASREFARILGLDEDELYKNLSDKEKMYYKVKSKIEKPLADEVREMKAQYNLAGIYLREDTKRYYPYEEMAATVLGFTGEDNNGLEGIERWYDEDLAGTPGRTVAAVDAVGNEISAGGAAATYAAEDGYSLGLTLNTDIQRSLEKNLADAVTKHNARQRGFAIAMNVNTGAILAIAVYPSYNPNQPYEILDEGANQLLDALISGSDAFIEQQGLARTLQWRNKALADTYEPGSVFKIITAAAALDSGVYTQESGFYCAGTMQIKGWDKPIGCAGTLTQQNTAHGQTTLRSALINSCNISFIQIGAGLGPEQWYDYLRAFGLTEPTGVDLPGEPSQASIDALVYGPDALGPVQLASCSFGQSNKYTAVQMITAVSAAVNGGNLMQPYIVDRVMDAEGNVIKTYEPVVKRQVISPETSAQICDMLEAIVAPDAPGSHAYIAGYRVGGKSGTSQKLDVMQQEEREDAFISSFVGFAPADDPEIAVLLALDEPEDTTMGNFFGGRLAGPAVREIIKDSCEVLGIEPVYQGDAELARTTVKMPKVVDMDVSAAQTALNGAGLTYRVVGGGATVTGQCPAAYSDIPHGGEVVLYTDASIPQEQVTMPDVVGRSAPNAISQLKGLGLNVLTQGAPDAGGGVVVGVQSAEVGAVLPRGSVVVLTMEDNTRVTE